MMTVSLCVVAFNEESFLPNLLIDLVNQNYPHELTEIVLVDGSSTDGTKSIMEKFQSDYIDFLKIKVLDNPKRIQAAGWNVAIRASECDVIIRIDAHTSIPADFTAKNMALQERGEYVTGGVRPCLVENPTLWRNTLLEVENSLFGSSISKSRHSGERRYVKTMFHAAYRREVFTKAGGFNENLLRTEDNEMHYRIRQAGYKLYFDPGIVSYQYARSSLKRMIKQKYGNGYWIGLTLGVCPGCVSIYHLVPMAFILGLIMTSILALIGAWQLTAAMWSAYMLLAIAGMLGSIVRKKANVWTILMPLLFLILHVSYGMGTIVGIVKIPWMKKALLFCPEIKNVSKVITERI